MTSMSRFLQDNFCGKNSWKSIRYSQSYDTVCQLALLGIKGLINITGATNVTCITGTSLKVIKNNMKCYCW